MATENDGAKHQSWKLLPRESFGHTRVCRKEVIMIRRFIQCKNTKERLSLMAGSNMQEWAEEELDTVMEIFGMKIPEGASKQEKWALIILSLTNKEVADNAALGAQKVFQDVEEAKSFAQEELERLSDLTAYLKVYSVNEVSR